MYISRNYFNAFFSNFFFFDLAKASLMLLTHRRCSPVELAQSERLIRPSPKSETLARPLGAGNPGARRPLNGTCRVKLQGPHPGQEAKVIYYARFPSVRRDLEIHSCTSSSTSAVTEFNEASLDTDGHF